MSSRPTPAELATLLDQFYSRKALNKFCSSRIFCGCRLERKMSDSQNRQRNKSLKVWVRPEEKEGIETAAGDCSTSVSSYLRSLGLGYVPPSKIDKTHILELAKVNGDQGRLGGLLKMWLTNEERQEEVLSAQVREILEQIDEVQRLLMKRVKELDKHR